MKMLGPLLAGILLAAPVSAGEPEASQCHHPPARARSDGKGTEGWVLVRGEKLKGAPAVALGELLQTPDSYAHQSVSVEGKVRRACARKGCWMELAPSESGAGIRVTFKDYGFFVPVDSAGSTARVEGMVKVAELSEERAKHYESEGAIVPRGKDGKPREVQLVATGVELRR
jgi:Domain of unknown function (DUF4920)